MRLMIVVWSFLRPLIVYSEEMRLVTESEGRVQDLVAR